MLRKMEPIPFKAMVNSFDSLETIIFSRRQFTKEGKNYQGKGESVQEKKY